MEFKDIRDTITEANDEALLADGFEDALIGYAQIFSRTVALYDRRKCIEILMKRDKMTEDAAEEYFCFNVTGAYMGDNTPAFATIVAKNGPKKAKRKAK